jgi:hypothetical protein
LPEKANANQTSAIESFMLEKLKVPNLKELSIKY